MEEVQWIWLNDRKNMMSKRRVLDSEIITLESRLNGSKLTVTYIFSQAIGTSSIENSKPLIR